MVRITGVLKFYYLTVLDDMVIGVLKEPAFETRVSLLPEAIATLVKKGYKVLIEQGAGEKSYSDDSEYVQAGAIISSRSDVCSTAEIALTMMPTDTQTLDQLRSKVLVGVYQPLIHKPFAEECASHQITSFSLDMLPRTTRAQTMDVLSSQANIAGYKAVIEAAAMYSRYFPMLMTAAGSIRPAKVLILGAGVAGLQAIATARRMGAVVEVFDTRPAVKEEVMSLGAKFIEVEGAADASSAGGYAVEQTAEFIQRQQARIAEAAVKSDIIITTAQVPGKKAPVLLTKETLGQMRKGSIIIDIASATGGNTEATKDNETVRYKGVSVVGNSSLPSTMPADASKLYGKNVSNFLNLIIDKNGNLNLDWNDDLVKGCCITHNGEVIHERVKAL